MNRLTPGLKAGYAVVAVITLTTAFNIIPSPPLATYLALIGMYLAALTLGLTPDVSSKWRTALIMVTPVIVALIVINPVEPGLYGYDPYPTLETLALYRKGETMAAVNQFGAWPGFYYFNILLHAITDVPYRIIAKFIPLATTLIPLVVYAGFRRYTADTVAFLIAITLSGVKALTGFQLKFVDEITASLLFFVLVVVLVKYEYASRAEQPRLLLLAAPAAAGVIVTHHYVSFLLTAFLIAWTVIGWIYKEELVFRRLPRLRVKGIVSPLTGFVAATTLGVGIMFLVVAPDFAARILGSEFLELRALIIDAIPQGSTAGGGPLTGGESPQPPASNSPSESSGPPPSYQAAFEVANTNHHSSLHRPLLIVFNIPLAGLTLLAGVATWRTSDIIVRRLGIITLGLYAVFVSLVFFEFLPIDPSRTVLYLYFSSIATVSLWASGLLSFRRWQTVGTAIAIAVIMTNVALINASVVNSSPSEASLIEDHPSIEQLTASNWYKQHGQELIQAFEPGLWQDLNKGLWSSRYSKRYGPQGYCVWRHDAGLPEYTQHTKIYTSGSFAVFRCSQYGQK